MNYFTTINMKASYNALDVSENYTFIFKQLEKLEQDYSSIIGRQFVSDLQNIFWLLNPLRHLDSNDYCKNIDAWNKFYNDFNYHLTFFANKYGIRISE